MRGAQGAARAPGGGAAQLAQLLPAVRKFGPDQRELVFGTGGAVDEVLFPCPGPEQFAAQDPQLLSGAVAHDLPAATNGSTVFDSTPRQCPGNRISPDSLSAPRARTRSSKARSRAS